MSTQQERQFLRQFFFDTWEKMNSGQPLGALEQQLANIIAQHPEYHSILNNPDANKDQDYTPLENSTNPFFHMALHASLMDQITTNRPEGVLDIYHALASKTGDSHHTEHMMMDILAAVLWQAQDSGNAPNDAEYLDLLKQLSTASKQ